MAVDPEQPFNREESYLADIAGQNVEVPPCPWNRKEAYLAEIGGRLDTMDDRISALATDLSFKGSVATENDLPADAAVGDTYITEDTGVMYVWVGEEWVAINDTGGGGGGVVELTSADYNYPVDNPNKICLGLLRPGYYIVKSGTKFYPTTIGFTSTREDDFLVEVSTVNPALKNVIYTDTTGYLILYRVSNTGGDNTMTMTQNPGIYSILTGRTVIDNLTSTYTASPLSANQGKVLKELIDKKNPTFYTANDISEGFTDAPLYSNRNLSSQIDGSTFYNALANGGFVLCQVINNDVDIAYTVVGYTIPYENSTTGFDHNPPQAYITNGLATMELSFTSAIPTQQGYFSCSSL